jgi:histidine triad (HIT) family protein
MQAFARKIALALKQAIPCKKVGVAVLGLEVAHAHIHLVPMQSEQDINFANQKKQFTHEEFEEIKKSIVACLV